MKFKKIILRNIRSYKYQEIEFPEGSILLAGDIGTGKTSILAAIEYALFGIQPGQKGTALLRNNAKLGEVTLEVEIGGKTVIIERKLKRAAKGVSNEYAAITIDGEKNESSITEIKSKIVTLLGYPAEFIKKNNILYRYTVYTPQEQMKQIILEDPATRMDILRHVFGIDKYKRMSENLSLILTNMRSDVKVMQSEIKNLEEDSMFLQTRKEHTQKIEALMSTSEKEWEEKTALRVQAEKGLITLEEKIAEKYTFEKEIDKTKILIGTKHETLALINRECEEMKKLLAETQNVFNEKEYAPLIEKIKEIRTTIEKITTHAIELMGQISSSEKEQMTQAAKKDKIFALTMCPTCLQDVSEVHKHNIFNETETKIAHMKSLRSELQKERDALVSKLAPLKEELVQLEEKKERFDKIRLRLEYVQRTQEKIEEREKQRMVVEQDIQLLSMHLDNLKENLLKYSAFEHQYKTKQNEVRTAQLEEKKVEITLAELRKELQITQKEIVRIQGEIAKKEKRKEYAHTVMALSAWLETQFATLIEFTERNVLLRLRNEFSRIFRNWFLVLVPENGLDCHLDENFTPILRQGEIEMEYEFLSGGERTAVALAYRLALNQTVNSVLSKIKTRGLVILDEPTDGFSEAQINKVRDILDELNATQLIMVSHEQKIESFVDHVFRVTKENDVSSVLLDSTA